VASGTAMFRVYQIADFRHSGRVERIAVLLVQANIKEYRKSQRFPRSIPRR
jgi:hypothetical protein